MMLTIIVKPKRELVEFSCGSKFTCFRTVIGGTKQPLADCIGVHEKDVEIVLKIWLVRKRLSLTPRIKQAILKFVGYYSTLTNSAFDCYAFANLVAGVQQHPKEYMLGFWNIAQLDDDPAPGEIIFLTTESDRQFYHAAVHLGYGLYLSVFGAGGGLEIALLPDMRREFGAQNIMRATPRGKAATYP